jgi:hypothetical protein
VQTPLDPLEAVRAAIADLERAHQVAVDAINSAVPAIANQAVNELIAATKRLAEADIVLRTHTAGRVWDAERLSLAALGRRFGVSKSRAGTMMEEVKKEKEKRTADDHGDS